MTANPLERLQAENGLWHELWAVAIDEAGAAKDSVRRVAEIDGLSEREVVDVYFTYHPEMKRWAEAHINGGTCVEGMHELSEGLKVTRERRAAVKRDATLLYLKTKGSGGW